RGNRRRAPSRPQPLVSRLPRRRDRSPGCLRGARRVRVVRPLAQLCLGRGQRALPPRAAVPKEGEKLRGTRRVRALPQAHRVARLPAHRRGLPRRARRASLVTPSRAILGLTLASVAIACGRSDACKEPSVSRLTVWDVEVSKDGSTLSIDGDSSLTV